jgi:hypothetical protein
MSIVDREKEPDWWAVTQAAQGLGINTRRLVALHDAETAITWALRMSREHSGIAALSYFELAVMLGHRDAKVTAGASLEWNELLRAVEKLQAAVKVKADEERRAADEAAAAAKAAAEKEAAEAAEAMVVLAEMAHERGLTRVTDLGDMAPLDAETKAKYLERARARAAALEENDADREVVAADEFEGEFQPDAEAF